MNIKGYVKLLSLPILAMSAIVLASFMGMFSTKGGTPRTQVYACPTPQSRSPARAIHGGLVRATYLRWEGLPKRFCGMLLGECRRARD